MLSSSKFVVVFVILSSFCRCRRCVVVKCRRCCRRVVHGWIGPAGRVGWRRRRRSLVVVVVDVVVVVSDVVLHARSPSLSSFTSLWLSSWPPSWSSIVVVIYTCGRRWSSTYLSVSLLSYRSSWSGSSGYVVVRLVVLVVVFVVNLLSLMSLSSLSMSTV